MTAVYCRFPHDKPPQSKPIPSWLVERMQPFVAINELSSFDRPPLSQE